MKGVVGMYRLLFIILLILTACDSGKKIELKDEVSENFILERYLGQWREVARIDNSFERGLTRVTADYSRDSRGRIRVVNRGWSEKKNKWKEARGYIKTTEVSGRLRVSFFRPFYADYIVLDIDSEYRYALVGGGSSNYLWILSRSGRIPDEIRKNYIEKAEKLGYKVDNMIFFNN